MATFDQLPADQRAIVELVLKRGRSYDALSDMLGMPEARVRELARAALVHLAPVSADRVDPEWRDQVADYALGQQSGPESAATKGHLRRSEPARAWLLSLLDSLDQLYAAGARPELPEDGSEPPRARERRERPASAEEKPARALSVVSDREKPEAKEASATEQAATTGAASRRRTIVGGVVLALLAVGLVLILTGVFDSGGGGGAGTKATTAANAAGGASAGANGQAQVLGELELKPTARAGKGSVGIAQLVTDGKTTQVGIRAKLPPLAARHAYQVWLYNSRDDVVSLGARRADAQGNFTGTAPLPKDFGKYQFIDISDEPIKNDEVHSGNSMLRGAFADLVTAQELRQQQQQQQQGGAQTQTQP